MAQETSRTNVRPRKWVSAIAIGPIIIVSSFIVCYQSTNLRAAFGFSPSPPPSAPSLPVTLAEVASGQGWAESTSATSITTNSFATANADVLLAAVTNWKSTVTPTFSNSGGDSWTSCGSSSVFSTSSAETTYTYCFYTNIGSLISSVTVTPTTARSREMTLDVVSFSGKTAIANIGSWGYEDGNKTTVSAVAFPTE